MNNNFSCGLRTLRKAHAHYHLAVLSLGQSSKDVDDPYLDIAVFHIQQALEFTLKGYLKIGGIAATGTHKISKLVNLIKDSNLCQVTKWLEVNKKELTRLESTCKYSDSSFYSYTYVKDLLCYTKTFLYVNGVCQNIMPEVTEDVRHVISSIVPTSIEIQDNLSWNILYLLHRDIFK